MQINARIIAKMSQIYQSGDWQLSWHAANSPPDGVNAGASAVCITAPSQTVIVSEDGQTWDVPGGRPEGDETLIETLRRELLQEACATLLDAQLLGYGRGECLSGSEAGLILRRSFWLARVQLNAWQPEFEIRYRREIALGDLLRDVRQDYAGLYREMLLGKIDGLEV